MTRDKKIGKFLNIWLKWQTVNGFKLEVNGLEVTYLELYYIKEKKNYLGKFKS